MLDQEHQVFQVGPAERDAGHAPADEYPPEQAVTSVQRMENTLRRIRELEPFLDSVLALPAGVYPPTEWGRFPHKYGIQLKDNYISEFIVYPLKYQVPLRHWKPIPLSYDLMGKEASQVTFLDIVDAHDEFMARIRNDTGIPNIPDNYFLIADLPAGRHRSERTCPSGGNPIQYAFMSGQRALRTGFFHAHSARAES